MHDAVCVHYQVVIPPVSTIRLHSSRGSIETNPAQGLRRTL